MYVYIVSLDVLCKQKKRLFMSFQYKIKFFISVHKPYLTAHMNR